MHTLALTNLALLLVRGLLGQEAQSGPRPITDGPVAVRVVERGALLAEDFVGAAPDTKVWRIWHSDPEKTSFAVRNGRFELTARGEIGHNGLWQLATAKTKDVVLIARMDVRSAGPDPHALALHLCGGEGARSPDHWTEVVMYDQGPKARFSYWSTAPGGAFVYDASKELVLDRAAEDGFLAKVEMEGGANRATTWVFDGAQWRQIGPAVELDLRTIHCEVKYRGGMKPRGPGETTSRAWFRSVRMYPRPEANPVGIRLVREDGSQVWSRGANEAWPPKVRIGSGPERSIEDLTVELRTLDGKTLISSVKSQNMGFYMLPLKGAPWREYPVGCRIRLVVDGKPLGQDAVIECSGLSGLYPDSVYDVVLR